MKDYSIDILFEINTPIDFSVRTTRKYWELITTIKHPVLKDRIEYVKRMLNEPDFIRQSKNDLQVYLFYRQETIGRWLCVVVKHQDDIGFIVTAYVTDSIKEGILIWKK